jgi:hypothetical protein
MKNERRMIVVYCPKPGGVVQSVHIVSYDRQTIDQAKHAEDWCKARGARYVALIDSLSNVCVDIGDLQRGDLHDVEECGARFYSPRAVRGLMLFAETWGHE